MPRITSPAITSILLLLAGSCAHGAPPPRDKLAQTTTETHQSTKFGYSWTLPEDWEFVPVTECSPESNTSSIDVIAARKKGVLLPKTEVLVSDLIAVRPTRERHAKDYERLELYGQEVLRQRGAQVIGTRRLRMAGNDAVEVSGVLGEEKLSVRLLYSGRRKFEFRCLGFPLDSGWPCESAFESFEIADIDDVQEESYSPRVLHLRDPRFGIEFDPPDDSWLAIGPLTGGGGAQVVWIWRDGNRQIDVQAFDLSIVCGEPPHEEVFASRLAAGFETNGAVVTIEQSTLAGTQCYHLVVNRSDGSHQDMFIQNRANTNYSILITQRTRDPELVETVRERFRITSKRSPQR